jgi:hypothetical protein
MKRLDNHKTKEDKLSFLRSLLSGSPVDMSSLLPPKNYFVYYNQETGLYDVDDKHLTKEQYQEWLLTLRGSVKGERGDQVVCFMPQEGNDPLFENSEGVITWQEEKSYEHPKTPAVLKTFNDKAGFEGYKSFIEWAEANEEPKPRTVSQDDSKPQEQAPAPIKATTPAETPKPRKKQKKGLLKRLMDSGSPSPLKYQEKPLATGQRGGISYGDSRSDDIAYTMQRQLNNYSKW